MKKNEWEKWPKYHGQGWPLSTSDFRAYFEFYSLIFRKKSVAQDGQISAALLVQQAQQAFLIQYRNFEALRFC